MDVAKFKQLIRTKESEFLDLKIRCDAFLSNKKYHNAELAKDICAMSNNGNRASYIIIGVSDDAKSFRTVTNPSLTEENLQSFCKTAIFPPPKIKLYRGHFLKSIRRHAQKEFTVIQVGPHPREAFRLLKDFMFYDEKVCLRRNEVWIRRGSTSDLATPEEIERLVNHKAPVDKIHSQSNTIYEKLPFRKQEDSILSDLRKVLDELGIEYDKDKLILTFKKSKYVFRIIPLRGAMVSQLIERYVRTLWKYEHGFLFLIIGGVSRSSFSPSWEIMFKEKWGWFTSQYLYRETFYSFRETFYPYPISNIILPNNVEKLLLAVLALPNIKDTDTLRTSLLKMINYIEEDSSALKFLRDVRANINSNIKKWKISGWPIDDPRAPSITTPRKRKMQRIAENILALSKY